MSSQPHRPREHGNPQRAISDAVARRYKQHLGRGPTKVVTMIGGDVVTCVVTDMTTAHEQTLLDLGAPDLVHEARTRVQRSEAMDLSGIVEESTGRRVTGHVPGYRPELGAATEVFLLEPVADAARPAPAGPTP